MSYRKIVVDGKEYNYTVGKTHVKVVGVGVWPKEEVGEKVRVWQYCDCCGEPLSYLYKDHVDPVRLEIKPSHIARTIKAFV